MKQEDATSATRICPVWPQLLISLAAGRSKPDRVTSIVTIEERVMTMDSRYLENAVAGMESYTVFLMLLILVLLSSREIFSAAS